MPTGLPSLRQSVIEAAAQIAMAPELRDTAARDAELLLLHTLGISRAALFAYPERELTADEQARFEASVERRIAREPVQYITGEQEFFGLPLRVTPAVLIPRPETEHLVEAVLERIDKTAAAKIVDIGTGSGAIAIALAANLPLARITAVDLSEAALTVATENAAAHGLGNRIRFLHSDLLDGLGYESGFDAVVSNPPYIPEADRATLHAQVREFEPGSALFAGAAGLDVYRRLIPQAMERLAPGGLLAMEFGHGQCDAITALLEGWREVSFVADLQGIPRVALARRVSA